MIAVRSWIFAALAALTVPPAQDALGQPQSHKRALGPSKLLRMAALANLRQLPSDVEGVEHVSPSAVANHDAVHYAFKTKTWQLPFIRDSGLGGPFAVLGPDTLLFVARCGTISIVKRNSDELSLQRRATLPFASEIECEGGPHKTLSGVKGMLLVTDKPGTDPGIHRSTMFLTYSHEPTRGCATLKVVRFPIELGPDLRIGPKTDVFVSQPCAPAPVLHNEIGGAVAEAGGYVYFSVGDFGNLRSQHVKSDFGRIYRVAIGTPQSPAELFAEGVRNPEGLAFAPLAPRSAAGKAPAIALYATDMGPKGGDEVNHVRKGDHLGFPISSYGIEYGHDIKRDYAGQFDRHDFGKKPLYVFMPAVAPTAIAYYDKPMFRSWGHSLIMTTLRGRTVYRLRLDEGRIVYAEPIAVTGQRMRHVQVAADGSIYVKADPDVLIHIYRDAPPTP